MGDIELSVVIPTYGRPKEVARAVASALAQGVDVEVVVVDDGSPEPIQARGQNVSVLRLHQNCGAAAARNAGVAASRAAWIAFLDSDDVWPPGSLRPRLEAARASDGAQRAIWACAFADVWPDGRRSVRTPKASADVRDFVSGCWSCPGSTALFSRAAWEISGGQDPALRRLEDYDWLLRWVKTGGLLAVHPVVGAEISRGGRAHPRVIADAAERLRAKNAAIERRLRIRMESYLALELGAARLHHGDAAGASLALARSWALRPRMQPALERFWSVGKGG